MQCKSQINKKKTMLPYASMKNMEIKNIYQTVKIKREIKSVFNF